MQSTVRILCLLALAAWPALASETPKPKAAGDDAVLRSELLSIEQQIYDGWKAKSLRPVEEHLAPDALAFSQWGLFDRAAQVEQQKGANERCDVKSVRLHDAELHRVSADVVFLIYLVDQDAACGGGKAPSPIRNGTLYARRGGKWKIVLRTSAPLQSP
jgi:hypothetical protein